MPARRLLILLFPVLLLAVAIPAPIAAATTKTDLIGTVELVHGEDFDAGTAIYDYHLRTATGRVALKFAGDAPAGFLNGATVKVHGRRDGGTFVADGAAPNSGALAADGAVASPSIVLASAPSWSGPRKLAVILINFTNNASKPFTRAYANGVVFTNANSVRAYFAEQSHNAVVLAGTTFDWIKIPYANTTCDFGAWELAAKAALTARGTDLSSYTNFMLMFPQTNACAWRGLGYLPGATTWINGTPNLRTPAHELAHNFGVHHASTLRCWASGIRVALSATCQRSEYGDPFTTMGASSQRHDTNLALVQMGYLPKSATRSITASGTYVMAQPSATSGVRILSVPRGDGTFFYLEYRRPSGTYFDNFSSTSAAVRGVTIRLSAGWTAITQSQLIDTVPSTTTFDDASLRTGKTFRDYKTGTTITVISLGTTYATVKVTLPADTTAPTTPGAVTATPTSTSTIGLAWTPATDNRAVAGYRIWRNGALVTTTSATTIGYGDAGLTPATAYAYTVRAVDGAGNLSAVATASATTRPSIDTTAPTAPTATIAQVSAKWAAVSWSAATDNVGVVNYEIYRNGQLYTTVAGGTRSAQVPTSGTYTVAAMDAAGNRSSQSAPVSL